MRMSQVSVHTAWAFRFSMASDFVSSSHSSTESSTIRPSSPWHSIYLGVFMIGFFKCPI